VVNRVGSWRELMRTLLALLLIAIAGCGGGFLAAR
jgi:hypothetical protein